MCLGLRIPNNVVVNGKKTTVMNLYNCLDNYVREEEIDCDCKCGAKKVSIKYYLVSPPEVMVNIKFNYFLLCNLVIC